MRQWGFRLYENTTEALLFITAALHQQNAVTKSRSDPQEEERKNIMTVEFWYLIGAALVFWMQAGFAMVETGFTRAKNAGNIIMKNLMDFCIGTVVFSLLGYSLMMGEDVLFGLIGLPNMDLFGSFKEFIASPGNGDFTAASQFVFNLVFCATTATLVSGAMAVPTKFDS